MGAGPKDPTRRPPGPEKRTCPAGRQATMTHMQPHLDSGEPALAWLSRHSARAHRLEVEFEIPGESFRLFSEAWGTFLLVLVAAGGGVVGATAYGGDLTLAMKALAPGVMVMAIIFFMGTISGAHLNPAVSPWPCPPIPSASRNSPSASSMRILS